jgi:hypothetical protein
MYCSKCGVPGDNQADFCSACGQPFRTTVEPAVASTETPSLSLVGLLQERPISKAPLPSWRGAANRPLTYAVTGLLVAFIAASLFAWAVPTADYADNGSLLQGSTKSMWSGLGLFAGLLALGWLAFEALRSFGALGRVLDPRKANLIGAGLGISFVALTTIEFSGLTTLNTMLGDLGNVYQRTGAAFAGLGFAILACALALLRLLPESAGAKAQDVRAAAVPLVQQAVSAAAPHLQTAGATIRAGLGSIYRHARPHARLIAGCLVGLIIVGVVVRVVAWPIVFPDRGNVHLVTVSAVQYTPISATSPLYMAQAGRQGLTSWSATPSYRSGSLLIVTMRSSSSQPMPLTASNFKVHLSTGVPPTAESKRFTDGLGNFTGDLTADQQSKLTLVIHLQKPVTGIRSLHYDDGQGNWGDVKLAGLQVKQPFSTDTLQAKKLALFNQSLPALPTADAADTSWPELTAARLLARPDGGQIIYASSQDSGNSYDNGVAYVALVTATPADQLWSMLQKQVTEPLAASGYATIQNRSINKPGEHYFWLGEQHRIVDDGYGNSSPMTDTAGVSVRQISTFAEAIGSSTGSPEGATLSSIWKDGPTLALYKLPYTLVEYYVDGPKAQAVPVSTDTAATAPTNSAAASYVAQVDRLLASSAQTLKSMAALLHGIDSGQTSNGDAMTQLSALVSARDAAVRTVLQMQPPAAFRSAQQLLLRSLRIKRSDDRAEQSWVAARGNGGTGQAELNALNRIDAQSNAAKKQFLAAYGPLRQRYTGKSAASLPRNY